MATRETSPVALLIKQELAKKRMSRASLAADAKISLSALEKGLSGQRSFSDTAMIRMEEVLGINLRPQQGLSAPDEMGGYARTSVSWLEGNYLTIRPSSKRADDLFTYITDVTWNHDRNHLVFHEMARLDSAYAQKGDVAIPHQTGHIYFTTNRHGHRHRLMLMRRQLPSPANSMACTTHADTTAGEGRAFAARLHAGRAVAGVWTGRGTFTRCDIRKPQGT